MGKQLFDLPDRHTEALHHLREATGLSMSDIVRRVLEKGLREESLNELLPTMSGQLALGRLYP